MKNRKHGQLYRSRRNKQYGWRLVAANGARIAVAGETYEKKQHAERMFKQLFPEVELVDKGWSR
jgi:uncharacterized protein YegP (UPF0339 family)